LALLVGILPTVAFSALFVGLNLQGIALALAGYLFGATFALVLLRRGYPHKVLGLGNLTTIFRMTMVAALLAPLATVEVPWAVVVVATFALVLDGVDGYLARRAGLVSSFGGTLDMEIDSILALILALNVWAAGIAGPWIILLGLPRYLFIVAAKFMPWLDRPLPPSLSRRVICVVQVASIIGLYAQILPNVFVIPVAMIVAALLIWSFGRDIIWLWRARP
jgi:phosphatidylglycerophosphate synthase